MATSTSWSDIKKALDDSKASVSVDEHKDLLENRSFFPSFQQLPYDNSINELYYAPDTRNGVWKINKTWCFLADITNDDSALVPFLRNRVLVTDRDGFSNIPIFFYPETGFLDFELLKRGRTLAVLYAEYHHFLDGQIGLRIENLDTVNVFNSTLEQLFSLSSHYWTTKGRNVCWGCGTHTTAEELKKCAKCKVATYCDRECQRKDWTERHKVWCRVMPDYLQLIGFKYEVYRDSQYFRCFRSPFQ